MVVAVVLWVALHGAGETFASFHPLTDVNENLLEPRVLRLLTENVQTPNERNARVDHGRKLPAEDGEVDELDFAVRLRFG